MSQGADMKEVYLLTIVSAMDGRGMVQGCTVRLETDKPRE